MMPIIENPDDEHHKLYEVFRMLPPGTHKYFYTKGVQIVVAKD